MTEQSKTPLPIHPGTVLLEHYMKPEGLSINGLARDISVPPNRISEIVNAKRAITADTALRLGKYFQNAPETWLGMQAVYDLEREKTAAWPKHEKKVKVRGRAD
jgi:antitoxin HigA-1